MAFFCCNLDFVNNVNNYSMHILCLYKTNVAVNLAHCIFLQNHFQ